MNLRDDSVKTEIALIKQENSNKQLADLLDTYPEELLQKLIDNKEILNKIASKFNCSVSTISKAAMVMKCNSKTCPFKEMCILVKNGLAPDTYLCPIENKIVDDLSNSMIEELTIDRQNSIEMELLYDLIDIKLLDMRTSGLLSTGSVVQEIVITSGNMTSKSKDISPEIRIKLDLKRLKFSIMEEFMATRKAKKKYGLGSGDRGFENIIREAMKVNNGQVME